MKYHYKSPEEIKETIESHRSRVHPYRNRTFLLIFADTSIFVMVFLILHFSGILDFHSMHPGSVATLRGLEFRINISRESPGGNPQFLVVRNLENTSRVFPETEGEFALLESLRFEFNETGKLIRRIPLSIQEKILRPEESKIYRLEPADPSASSFEIFFKFKDGREIKLQTGLTSSSK